MYENLFQFILKYGPEVINSFYESLKKEESIGNCCCCGKELAAGLKNTKFDLVDSQIVLCCDDPICDAFLRIKALGSQDVYF